MAHTHKTAVVQSEGRPVHIGDNGRQMEGRSEAQVEEGQFSSMERRRLGHRGSSPRRTHAVQAVGRYRHECAAARGPGGECCGALACRAGFVAPPARADASELPTSSSRQLSNRSGIQSLWRQPGQGFLPLARVRKFARKTRAYRHAYRDGQPNSLADVEKLVKVYKSHRSVEVFEKKFCHE